MEAAPPDVHEGMEDLDAVAQAVHLQAPCRCLNCDYLLRGLPTSVCPECGHAFNLNDRSTWHAGRRMPKWARLWIRPLPKWLVLAPVVPVFYLLADPMMAYMVAGVCVGGLFGAIPIALLGGFRSTSRSAIASYYRHSGSSLDREDRAWLTSFLIVLALSYSTLIALPTRILFLPFAGWFTAAREGVVESGKNTVGPMWIGPWRVEGEHLPSSRLGDQWPQGVTVFYTRGGIGSIGSSGSGFIYLPSGQPFPPYNEGTHGRIIGNWWYYTDD